MEDKEIQKDLFLDIILWFTLICLVIICSSVCTYKYSNVVAKDKLIDSLSNELYNEKINNQRYEYIIDQMKETDCSDQQNSINSNTE
jgi:hypothetical protein